MPRRYATYDKVQFMGFHRTATTGAYIMACGLILAGSNLLHALLRGKKAPANPWGGSTLEWQTTSPPPHDNFATTPGPVGDPYDLHGIVEDKETGEWYRLPDAGNAPPAH